MKKRNGKGIIALLLVFSMLAMLSAGVFADNMPGYGGGGYASYVGEVFDYIDPNDFNAIEAANQKMIGLSYGNSNADINDSDVGALVNASATAQEIADLLKYTLAVYFSTNVDDFNDAIVSAQSNITATAEKLFGTVDNWFDLFINTKKDAQMTVDPEGKFFWAKGSAIGGGSDELYVTMDRLQVERLEMALDDAKYAAYKTGFENMGWTAESFVAACRAVVNKADSNSAAEFALLKAAARYAMSVEINGEKLDLVYAGRDLGSKGTIFIYKPGTYTMSMFIKLVKNLYMVDNNVTNVVGVYSSNPALATFTGVDKTERTMTLEINEGVTGYADIVIKRDPSGTYYPADTNEGWNSANENNNWLSRFRIIVPKQIGTVSNIAFDDGILSWNAATNAESYFIDLYKDGNYVETVETDKLSYDFTSKTLTAGTYTAVITAAGSTYGDYTEMGDAVDSSPVAYVVTDEVPIPANVKWNSDDDFDVAWDGVTDADSYVVYIYKGQECLNPNGDNVAAAPGTTNYTFDAKDYFTATGEYVAKVVAIRSDKRSAEGASDVKYFVMTFSLRGTVKLQNVQKKINQDNLFGKLAKNTALEGDEAVITIEGISGKWYTDENGEYNITGLKSGTYKILFECDCYLARQLTVKIDGDTVQDANLYYGDFTKMTSGSDIGDRKINMQDVSDFLFYYWEICNSNRPNTAFEGIGAMAATAERAAILQNIGRTTSEPRD